MALKPLHHPLLEHFPSNQLCTANVKHKEYLKGQDILGNIRIPILLACYLMFTQHIKPKKELHIGCIQHSEGAVIKYMANL